MILHISNEAVEAVQEAYECMRIYILYVKNSNFVLHAEANGTPLIDRKIDDAFAKLSNDKIKNNI